MSVVDLSYVIEECVGRGGQGEVCRGRFPDGRLVAVKTVRASRSTRERLAREARLLAGLPRHRNVRGFLGVVERDDGDVHLLQEWVEGVSLAAVLEAGRLPLHAALYIVREVLTGLEECIHAAGVVHRDLSPGNILIGADGTVKIADFGIAKELEGPATTGGLRGTLCYLSPEQARREKPTTVSDLFAVGTLLYELLTGHPPFRGTDREIQGQLIDAQPVSSARAFAEWVPRKLDTVISRLHAKDAAKRFQTAAEVRADLPRVLYGREALVSALNGLGVTPIRRPTAEPQVAGRPWGRSWRALGLVAAGATMASVALVATDGYRGWAEPAAMPDRQERAASLEAVDPEPALNRADHTGPLQTPAVLLLRADQATAGDVGEIDEASPRHTPSDAADRRAEHRRKAVRAQAARSRRSEENAATPGHVDKDGHGPDTTAAETTDETTAKSPVDGQAPAEQVAGSSAAQTPGMSWQARKIRHPGNSWRKPEKE